jgi:predicted metalloendopeptidase
MIKNLKATFVKTIAEADWMDDTTKAIAKEKVDNMIELVGFPDWITKKQDLETYYYDGVSMISKYHIIYKTQTYERQR